MQFKTFPWVIHLVILEPSPFSLSPMGIHLKAVGVALGRLLAQQFARESYEQLVFQNAAAVDTVLGSLRMMRGQGACSAFDAYARVMDGEAVARRISPWRISTTRTERPRHYEGRSELLMPVR